MGLLNVRQQKYLHTMHKVMGNRDIQGGEVCYFLLFAVIWSVLLFGQYISMPACIHPINHLPEYM